MLHVRRIVVPLDFSPHSDHALEYAAALARQLGASLHPVHVFHIPAFHATPGGLLPPQDFLGKVQDAASRELEARAGRIRGDEVEVESTVLEGTPAEAICEFARGLPADLIVMGTHGRTGVAHWLLGSVAERTLRMAPCPVLTVRAPEE